MNIGILSPANIAVSKFLPALSKVDNLIFKGVAVADRVERGNLFVDGAIDESLLKAKRIIDIYGGGIYKSFDNLLNDNNIDAVYIPLPPALHYLWGKKALKNGKHILMEKPFTVNFENTNELIEIASSKGCVVYENYMFIHHIQCSVIKNVIESGSIGNVRLYRMSFGFPLRDTKKDFRYKKEYGGGSIWDCGGYPIKLATMYLNEPKVVYCELNCDNEFGVDLYGNIIMEGSDGIVAELSFGMDNDYRCSLEVWGSTGTIKTDRIFTAPIDLCTTYSIIKNGNKEDFVIGCDDTFYKSIQYFKNAIDDNVLREQIYADIRLQANHLDNALRLFNEE